METALILDYKTKSIYIYMKKILFQKHIFTMIMLHLLSLIFVGCSNDHSSDEPQILPQEPTQLQEPIAHLIYVFPTICINGYSYPGYVFLDPAKSSANCIIKKVVFYWDDKLVATDRTGVGIDLYLDDTNAAEGSEHTIKAIATVGGDGYKDKEVTVQEKVKILTADSAGSGLHAFVEHTLKNGDEVIVAFWCYYYGQNLNPVNTALYTVNLYLDDNLVSTGNLVSLGCRTISYRIENASIGEHYIDIESIGSSGTQRTHVPITITE